jgi:hypothetical protein
MKYQEFWNQVSARISKPNKLLKYVLPHCGESIQVFKTWKIKIYARESKFSEHHAHFWSEKVGTNLTYLGHLECGFEDIYFGENNTVYSVLSGEINQICRIDEIGDYSFEPLTVV